MKNWIGTLLSAAVILPFFGQTANAFSTSSLVYSRQAFHEIISSEDVFSKIPMGNAITEIKDISSQNGYEFEVKAGSCVVTVTLDTSTPKGFIGNGLPHDLKVVDTTPGCNQ